MIHDHETSMGRPLRLASRCARMSGQPASQARPADPGAPSDETTDMALIGIYPGSFDPLHLGHVDVIRRAARIADRLVVAVLDNGTKTSLFTVEERLELLATCLKGMKGVEVGTFRGLLVDYAREQEATVVFRGLRAVSDFEYEFQMALMNRTLSPDLETVFLTPSQDLTFLSSRLVKEVSALGGSVDALVPAPILEALRGRTGR